MTYYRRRRSMAGFKGGGFGGIFDDATVAIARGINDGVTAALPTVQRSIESTVGNAVATNLPRIQTGMTTAITQGLTQGAAVAKTELASASSDLLPALQASVEEGGTKIVGRYKWWLIGAAAFVTLTTGAMLFLQYEQVRLLKGRR